MRWQPPAAGPAGRGAAGAGVGGGAGGGEGGCPPRLAAASRNLQEAAGPGEGGEGVWRGAWGPGPAGSKGPLGRSAGKEGRGEGRAASPRASRPPLCAESRVAAGAVACLPDSPDSDLASPGRAGAAARAALMARFRAAERAPSRSLSGLGTCPSASQGLLSMESGASRRPQRAGSGRAQPGDQARWRQPWGASPRFPAVLRLSAGPAGGVPIPSRL